MATCKTCYRMGYPLRNGICSSCRLPQADEPSNQNRSREQGWKVATNVKHKDPRPLLGENYAMKEKTRHYYPFRREPLAVPPSQAPSWLNSTHGSSRRPSVISNKRMSQLG